MLMLASAIEKRYPGVVALDGVDFDLREGEVHVLFGENGAGKSTLIGILSGMRRADSGAVMLEGKRIDGFMTPKYAREMGIAAVFQEFSLVSSLSILDNLFLGREISRFGWIDRKQMRRLATAKLKDIGFDLDLDQKVEGLSRALRQMVEIAKALLVNAKVLILDEPTASLTDSEADNLLDIVKRLRERGVGIIYVSHRMREIYALADRITVLRGGKKIGTLNAADIDESRLVEMMTGRRIDNLYPHIPHAPQSVRLQIDSLCSVSGSLKNVGLSVRSGEVVGIAGLVGCGKSEVGRAIFGLEGIKSGRIFLDGKPISPRSPRQMLQQGLAYFPSDRGAEGLALERSVHENCLYAALDLPRFSRFGWINAKAECSAVFEAMTRLGLRPMNSKAAVSALSGGNRQKVMLGRGLTRDLQVFIFDEPTVGIDVGAKVEVYQFIAELVRQGAAILVISSELPEILALSNRVYVMHDGCIVDELQGEKCTSANVLAGFFGNTPLIRTEVA